MQPQGRLPMVSLGQGEPAGRCCCPPLSGPLRYPADTACPPRLKKFKIYTLSMRGQHMSKCNSQNCLEEWSVCVAHSWI